VTTEIEADADLPPQLKTQFNKIRWQHELARRGYERNGMSPELAEALRKEIRTALDASGGPFDVNVARRVYDLAIAARDMCIAATGSVKEVVDQVADTNGPMESLVAPGTPDTPTQAAENFGSRLIREILATLPMLLNGTGGKSEDLRMIVKAIAEAEEAGLTDVAQGLRTKLFGRVLSNGLVIKTEDREEDIPLGDFEHGFDDGSRGQAMAAAFCDNAAYQRGYAKGAKMIYGRGYADGRVNAGPAAPDAPEYERGYKAGLEAYFLDEGKKQKPPVPPPGYGHTVKDQTVCSRCLHAKGDHWGNCRVSKRTGEAGEAAWAQCKCDAFVDAAGTEHPNHGVVNFGESSSS
jgi:hypothetical protein